MFECYKIKTKDGEVIYHFHEDILCTLMNAKVGDKIEIEKLRLTKEEFDKIGHYGIIYIDDKDREYIDTAKGREYLDQP
jgi:hypothetical protein